MVITFREACRCNLTYIIRGDGYRTYNMLYITTPYFSRYYSNVAGVDVSTPERGFRIIKLIKK